MGHQGRRGGALRCYRAPQRPLTIMACARVAPWGSHTKSEGDNRGQDAAPRNTTPRGLAPQNPLGTMSLAGRDTERAQVKSPNEPARARKDAARKMMGGVPSQVFCATHLGDRECRSRGGRAGPDVGDVGGGRVLLRSRSPARRGVAGLHRAWVGEAGGAAWCGARGMSGAGERAGGTLLAGVVLWCVRGYR